MKLLAVTTLLLVLFAAEANACSCAGSAPPCEAYGRADAVFIGTVSFSSSVTFGEGRDRRVQRLIRFTVDEAFRGIDGSEAEVTTGLGGGDCGYGFSLGGQYLVYAYRYKDGLSTGICTRTRNLSNATEDLAYIRGLAKTESGATIFDEVTRLNRNYALSQRD